MEILSERDIQGIIDYNQDTLTERDNEFNVKRSFNGDKSILDSIFCKVNNLSGILELRSRIIKKATKIFCEIAHCQPFVDGNRATAYAAGMFFLRRNGFTIPLNTSSDEEEIMALIDKTKEKTVERIEEKLCQEIECYLIEKVIKS
jgi:prophage maintenance system killer protein